MTNGLGITGEVLAALRCPLCEGEFRRAEATLRCSNGHAFDIARQGYANLRTGEPSVANADTSAMVEARERVLGAGHYDPIAARLAEVVREHTPSTARSTSPVSQHGPLDTVSPAPGLVIDLAGGTGHYLSAVLDALPGHAGLCIELSTPALKRAARAHDRAAAIGCDLRRRLPLSDGAAAVVLSVFGPRNPPEIERVLAPGGLLAVVTPTDAHLAELVGPLGMVRVDAAKAERLNAQLSAFAPVLVELLEYRVAMDHATLAALAGMGPSAHHTTPEALAERVAALPASVEVTVSVRISTHRRT